MILESQDQAPHWVPCSARVLLLPLSLTPVSLSLSQTNKQNLKKKKEIGFRAKETGELLPEQHGNQASAGVSV